MMGEQGLIELSTFFLLLPAVVLGFLAQSRHAGMGRVWLVALTLGCVYFAGEEVSWGQHLFGWATPDPVSRINDQQETNIHNISSWFDQKPRLLLELWVLGLTVMAFSPPLRRRWGRWDFLWADRRLAVPGLLAILVRLPERIADGFDATLPQLLNFRLAELQELMFAWVLLLFLWVSLTPARRT
ncbi:MAG: hypothetical protein R3200_16565, partial [Xanthomonadales bacterium]|nr:hypothetical protein [Xanthomonadales bacterium]